MEEFLMKNGYLVLSLVISTLILSSCGNNTKSSNKSINNSQQTDFTTTAISTTTSDEVATTTLTTSEVTQDVHEDTFITNVKKKLDYAKENMSVFDYDENSINETETRNIEVICTITVNNTPTKLKCTITGSDDNSIESMSIIYDDLGEWIREYYEDADCTIEKTSDEISEVDALNILRMFYASAILYTDVGLSSEDISDSCDILDTSLERYRYTGDYLTDESDSVSVKCGNYVYLLSITPNGSNALSLSVYSIDYYNENMDLAGLPHYSGPEI